MCSYKAAAGETGFRGTTQSSRGTSRPAKQLETGTIQADPIAWTSGQKPITGWTGYVEAGYAPASGPGPGSGQGPASGCPGRGCSETHPQAAGDVDYRLVVARHPAAANFTAAGSLAWSTASEDPSAGLRACYEAQSHQLVLQPSMKAPLCFRNPAGQHVYIGARRASG
jgi:hypothetical protein